MMSPKLCVCFCILAHVTDKTPSISPILYYMFVCVCERERECVCLCVFNPMMTLGWMLSGLALTLLTISRVKLPLAQFSVAEIILQSCEDLRGQDK